MATFLKFLYHDKIMVKKGNVFKSAALLLYNSFCMTTAVAADFDILASINDEGNPEVEDAGKDKQAC